MCREDCKLGWRGREKGKERKEKGEQDLHIILPVLGEPLLTRVIDRPRQRGRGSLDERVLRVAEDITFLVPALLQTPALHLTVVLRDLVILFEFGDLALGVADFFLQILAEVEEVEVGVCTHGDGFLGWVGHLGDVGLRVLDVVEGDDGDTSVLGAGAVAGCRGTGDGEGEGTEGEESGGDDVNHLESFRRIICA